jgi:mannan endo-1,4-beta-mannosidase
MAWRHVHRLLGALDPQISWVWSPAAVQQTRVTARLASLYPGDDYVNFVGVTGYARSGNRDSHAADTFDGTLRQIRAFTDKPVVLSEIGADGPRKSRWLASLGPYLRHYSDIRGFVYFNTSPGSTGATGTYELRRAADFVTFHTSLAAADSCARPATRPAASPDHSTGPAASFG